MLVILVWEAHAAPGGLRKVREVGQQGVGGGYIISLTFLSNAIVYMSVQTNLLDSPQQEGKIIDFLCFSVL
jgi:hypothetical protein